MRHPILVDSGITLILANLRPTESNMSREIQIQAFNSFSFKYFTFLNNVMNPYIYILIDCHQFVYMVCLGRL